jgi:DNA-binding transcriptional ArsR family regulator
VSTSPSSPVGADAVLGALGDPTRRSVLEAVAESGPLTATELAVPFGISRQAVSKHLTVLEQAGLVRATRVGREARYEVVPGSLDAATVWLDRVGAAWDRRLTRLRRHLADD